MKQQQHQEPNEHDPAPRPVLLPIPNSGEIHGFFLAEYNRLCAEIDGYIKETTNCVNFAIVASAGVWSWLATNSDWQSCKSALLIPAVLTALWGLRWVALQQTMSTIGAYLMSVEKHFYGSAYGWERHLYPETNVTNKRKHVRQLGTWGSMFLPVLLSLNIIIAIASWPNQAELDKSAARKAANLTIVVDRLADALNATAKEPVSDPLPPPAPALPPLVPPKP